MITVASRVAHFSYKHVAKPLLFRKDPDSVHDQMLHVADWMTRHKQITRPLSNCFAYHSPLLAQTYHGIEFNNPIGLSAGLDKNCQLPFICKQLGFGMIEVGSVTALPCKGNERPWFYRLPKTQSLVVHAGLANSGIDKNMETLLTYDTNLWQDIVLNVSIAKTNTKATATDAAGIDDYYTSMRKLLETNIAHMATINISCPNTYGGEPFTDPERLRRLLDKLSDLPIDIPVSLKMPIDKPWHEFQKLLDVAAQYQFIKFITIGNLAKDRSSANLLDNLPASVKGGLSGRPTFALSNALIRETYKIYKDRFVIVGVGGIFSAEDALIKLANGAHILELITGLVFQGPQLVGAINKDIAQFLRKLNTTLEEYIGSNT